jgi:hypothetical protein
MNNSTNINKTNNVNGYNVSRSWLKTLTKSGRIEALMGSEPSPFTYLYSFVLTILFGGQLLMLHQ